ncbi:TPA: hypothetical protein ACGFXT_003386 [Vibrio cholerae]|uniref:hypothetical protein n=1 Tax=Vibrio mimicus TaxID=674 RepID=UPI0012F4B1F0|nr:hypothetical protein [Vibrio mimicus]
MSELIREIRNLSSHQVIYSLACFAAIVSPGLLIIFTYKRELFLTLELFKLLMLSISLSVPILACTILLSASDSDEQSFDKITFFGYFISLILVYPTLFFSYMLKLPFSNFAIALIVLYLGLSVITWFDRKRNNKKET